MHLLPFEFAVHAFSLSPISYLALDRANVVQRYEDGTVDRMSLATVGIALIAIDAEATELAKLVSHSERILSALFAWLRLWLWLGCRQHALQSFGKTVHRARRLIGRYVYQIVSLGLFGHADLSGE